MWCYKSKICSQFWEVLDIIKNNVICGILGDSVSEVFAFMQKYWFQNLTWHWPDLLQKSSWVTSWGKTTIIYVYDRIIQRKCVARHTFYFVLVTFRDLTMTLTFLSMTFVPTHVAPFSDIYQHFRWVWALRWPFYLPKGPKFENVFWPLTRPWLGTWP